MKGVDRDIVEAVMEALADSTSAKFAEKTTAERLIAGLHARGWDIQRESGFSTAQSHGRK